MICILWLKSRWIILQVCTGMCVYVHKEEYTIFAKAKPKSDWSH